MFKVDRSAIGALLLAAAACSPTKAPTIESCAGGLPDEAIRIALADSLLLRTGQRNRRLAASQIEMSVIGVAAFGSCVSAGAISIDEGNGGGVVVFSNAVTGVELLAAEMLMGPHDPIAIDSGRLAVQYATVRGSGQSSERTAVLCALARDVWIRCADLMTSIDVAATGFPPSDTNARGLRYSVASQVSSHLDTLQVRSFVSIKRYGQAEVRRNVAWFQVLP